MTNKDPLITIKKITAEDTYPVRHPILRQGRPLIDCKFEGDDLESTFHFGLFYNKELVGIASFFKSNNPLLVYSNQYQLRGMAILEAYQGKKLGNFLLNYTEDFLKSINIDVIWCNARELATNFYLKRNYQIIGKPFNIPKIGKHYIMYKPVTNS